MNVQITLDHPAPFSGAEVTTCELSSDRDISLALAHSVLAPDERIRADRFVFGSDRDNFIRGRAFLRTCLGAELGVAADAVPLAVQSNGKPHLPGAPFDFNLSHSGDYAVFAITYGGAIGIDLELSSRLAWDDEALPGLARLCLTKPEREVIFDLPPNMRKTRFLEFWTAKEARMKLWGDGMALDPKTIHTRITDGRVTGYARTHVRIEHHFANLGIQDAICSVALSAAREAPT